MTFNRRIIITAIPIVGVNLTAVLAQFQFWHAHLTMWGIPGQLLFAGSLESVAIMLCYFAHLSMISADSAFKLRLGAILFALIIATMNGSHYLVNGAITAASVGVFACSAMSPILWGVYSRRQSRDILINNGLIEGRSVRLGSARWLFHPSKSFKVFSRAVWLGEQSPQAAISAYENARPISEPVIAKSVMAEPVTVEPVTVEPAEPAEPALPERALPAKPMRRARAGSKAALVRQALNDAPGDGAPAIAARLAQRGVSVSAAYVRQVKSVAARREIETRRRTMRALASGASSGYAAPNRIQDE
jgi:hypothetical protein